MEQPMNITKPEMVWDSHSSHVGEMLREMFINSKYTDVMLVCEDGGRFKVHRNVLSSCSEQFKEILEDDEHLSSIFLYGIVSFDLFPILELMYLGQTMINQEKTKGVLRVAEILKFKNFSDILGNNFTEDVRSETGNNGALLSDIKTVPTEELTVPTEELTVPTEEIQEATDDIDEIDVFQEFSMNHRKEEKCVAGKMTVPRLPKRKWIGKNKNEENFYHCDGCEYKSINRFHMARHKQSKHMNIFLKCDLCDYQTKRDDSLEEHRNFKHFGIQFPCELCDYIGSNSLSLKDHVKRMHKKTGFRSM